MYVCVCVCAWVFGSLSETHSSICDLFVYFKGNLSFPPEPDPHQPYLEYTDLWTRRANVVLHCCRDDLHNSICASKLAGMESGYACFCGNEVDQGNRGESPSMECNHVCFGDHTQPCGGDGWVIIFDSECSFVCCWFEVLPHPESDVTQ